MRVPRGRLRSEDGSTREFKSELLPCYVRRVMEVDEDPTYGRYVRIDHENGYETLYAHASATSIELGEEVRKNEVIALSGSTGESTGAHLHFEIWFEGETVDPFELVTQP